MAGDAEVTYVISDLHIGGDEQLGEVPFRDELLGFLERLEETDEDAELVINGDAFGLWEMSGEEGSEKFDLLADRYPDLFAQLRATGEEIPITVVAGNHDHPLAAHPDYRERFADHNVEVVRDRTITREVGGRTVHIEHGHQHDPNNRIEDLDAVHATPLGYFMNTLVTRRAGRVSDRGRGDWMKDIQAIAPSHRIPTWLVSKYFYREMHPVLRYAALPVLLLFNIALVLAVLAGLDLAGAWSVPTDVARMVLGRTGVPAAELLLTASTAVLLLLLAGAMLAWLFLRDVRSTARRFGLYGEGLGVDLGSRYTEAARQVFADDPDVAVFCYGHTHRPELRAVDGRAVVNTGTWLKRLQRVDVVAGRLPPVFYPSYQLLAARIAPVADGVEVSLERFPKDADPAAELTLLERLLAVEHPGPRELPDRLVVADDGVQGAEMS